MTLIQVVGVLVILLICPILGSLPLIDWITYGITGRQLTKLGTGNISVSAAFYHGGKWIGILAVVSEAFKGISAVLLARAFFPSPSVWELIALIALVMGRFWFAKGAGTTNVVWGIIIHDPIAAGLIFFIGAISFTINRHRHWAKLGILFLSVLILSLRNPNQPEIIVAAIVLAAILYTIYQKIPDDLDLPIDGGKKDSVYMLRFFRNSHGTIALQGNLDAQKVGQKAARLGKLKSLGYSVPDGWILPAGDDPKPLVEYLQPSVEEPLIVRSSAIGEDSERTSFAGQYLTIFNVTNKEALHAAILDCLASLDKANASFYRQDRGQLDKGMAVLIQKQIRGVFSGVAFSRNPVDAFARGVAIEALPGDATSVVSGKVTPQCYEIDLPETAVADVVFPSTTSQQELLQSVASLARELEELELGVPQDIEWTYDGETLWLLQARPITTLQPVWTRKIAAEVIPGLIRPLTWSINRPLTCGVWGDLFTLVLGKKAEGLDFQETATLHYSQAYFNATLLGEIFLRMGLPPESLEFLTRGSKFTKPPAKSTWQNLPGLLKLAQREWRLSQDFAKDKRTCFEPILRQIERENIAQLSSFDLLESIENILLSLEKATYYSILAPLSFALRKKILKIEDNLLDYSCTPEIESIRSLGEIAIDARKLLANKEITINCAASLFAHLAEIADGENILQQFHSWLNEYGYLSEVATDIAIPRWKDNPKNAKEILAQFILMPEKIDNKKHFELSKNLNWKINLVQSRLNLKGEVTTIYSKLLAYLRWYFIALEKKIISQKILKNDEDIFFLRLSEIKKIILENSSDTIQEIPQIIRQRREQFFQHQKLDNLPYIIYGNPDPNRTFMISSLLPNQQQLKGIGASAGQIEGKVKILRNLQTIAELDRQTIVIVPYTDSGWAPLLARVGGIISEVGGSLSHGAIVAREYGIPAVMNINNATNLFHDGQRLRIDGQKGLVEILTETITDVR